MLRLFTALQNGHSFVWLDEGEAEELAGLAPTVGHGASPLVLQGRKLFLGRMWQLEHDLAAEIQRLAQAEVEPVDWMSASQNLSCWFEYGHGHGRLYIEATIRAAGARGRPIEMEVAV